MIKEYWQQNLLEDGEFQFVYICSLLSNTVYKETKWFKIAGFFLTNNFFKPYVLNGNHNPTLLIQA